VGTRLAREELIEPPWLDAIRQLASVQARPAESYVTARHPTDSEAAALALTPAACVLVRVELAQDEQGRSLDYTTTVWPVEDTRLALG
jgi:DNA-binding GntR family transcriptional regulator